MDSVEPGQKHARDPGSPDSERTRRAKSQWRVEAGCRDSRRTESETGRSREFTGGERPLGKSLRTIFKQTSERVAERKTEGWLPLKTTFLENKIQKLDKQERL